MNRGPSPTDYILTRGLLSDIPPNPIAFEKTGKACQGIDVNHHADHDQADATGQRNSVEVEPGLLKIVKESIDAEGGEKKRQSQSKE